MKADHLTAMFIVVVVVIIVETSIIADREVRNILHTRNKFLYGTSATRISTGVPII
jgi:hypothetical protein